MQIDDRDCGSQHRPNRRKRKHVLIAMLLYWNFLQHSRCHAKRLSLTTYQATQQATAFVRPQMFSANNRTF